MRFGQPNCVRLGQSSIVLRCAGEPQIDVQRRLWALAAAAKTWQPVCEAVVGSGNLTLVYDRSATSHDALEARMLEAWEHAGVDARAERTIEIPAIYDGPDLELVARACALNVRDVIEAHAAASYVVAFIGFAPGFGYLEGLDARLRLPRRAQPRTHVPAGSIAIAGAQSAVYPLDSPGGWHLIGRTTLRMFDPQREPFALLAPGDRVRFVPQ